MVIPMFIILLGILASLSYVSNSSSTPSPQAQQVQGTVPTGQVSSEEEAKDLEEDVSVMKTIAILGEVSAISKNSIEIVSGDAKKVFSIDDEIFVISATSEDDSRKFTIEDIKKGANVTVIIDESNNKVAGIQIEE